MELIKTLTGDYLEYLKDESRTTGHATEISFPKSEEELILILKHAYETNTEITIQGARTGLAAAAVPYGGIVLNLSKMNRVLSCKKESNQFFFTVEPGLTLIELNKKISTKKFDTTAFDDEALTHFHKFLDAPAMFFTPDPTEATCTIGGMAACNASGAKSFLYGPTRNHITGIRVILSDGEILNINRGKTFAKGRNLTLITESGKNLSLILPSYTMPHTKNASGYFIKDNMDAIDVFIGSDGTLGVISQLTLSLIPLPKEIWGASCFFEEEKQGIDFVIKSRRSIANLAAFEYFDGNALQLLRNQKENGNAFSQLPEIPQQYDCCVYVEIHKEDFETAEKALFEIGENIDSSGGDSNNTWVARNENDITRLHFFRHSVPESSNMIIDQRKKVEPIITKLGADMSVPDEYLEEVFNLYRTTLAEENLESATWGHIGDNHLHVNILPRNAEDFHKGKALYAQWADRITKMGGAVSAEHGVGKIKSNFLEVMYGENSIEEMKDLKYALDSKGLLGRGNLFKPRREEN